MMNWTGKLVGGLLGLTLGPFGAMLGVALGHQYDEHVRKRTRTGSNSPLEIGEQLFRSAFRVMGHVAKADGRVSESEIAAARGIMNELRLNPAQVRIAIGHFNDGKAAPFSLDQELATLADVCQGRPHLLRVFLDRLDLGLVVHLRRLDERQRRGSLRQGSRLQDRAESQ